MLFVVTTLRIKPGLHISRKDRKQRFENMVWSPCGINDYKY